jgi:uncharacterized membrane protein
MTTDNRTTNGGAGRSETAENLAMIAYGLLFASIFFAGAPALIAVVIAYSQRREATARIRSHFDFQIRVFWAAFVLTLVAASCGLAGVIGGLGEMINAASITRIERIDSISIDLSHITIDGRVIALIVAAFVLGFLSSVWLLGASAVGFIRLASERGMGDAPAP